MSKSALIQEGGRPKKVGNLRRIITDSPNGRQPWVPQPLTNQKFISKNGMYLASNDDLDGFSKIRVNVAGGVAGMTKPTVNINGVEVVDPNTDPSVIPNYPAYVPYDGSIGNVIGVDPIDGNTYVSGLDKDGNLKKSKVPSSIRVLIPPAKTTYNVGDKILYYGLVVELLDENGQNCSNDDYPTGTISWSPVPYIVDGYKNYNLITPVETVDGSGSIEVPEFDFRIESGGKEYYISDYLTFPITCQKLQSYMQKIYVKRRRFGTIYEGYATTSYSFDKDVYIAAILNHKEYEDANYDTLFVICALETKYEWQTGFSVSTDTAYTGNLDLTTLNKRHLFDRVYSYNNKNAYVYVDRYSYDWSSDSGYIDYKVENVSIPLNDASNVWFLEASNYNASVLSAIGWNMVHGSIDSSTNIPVKWNSPYDGSTKQTTFQISIS